MIETEEKKKLAIQAVSIGAVILTAMVILFLAAYYVLFQNFRNLLSDYSIQLVQTMAAQGVTTVEHELQTGKEEASAMAEVLIVPDDSGQTVVFPEKFTQSDVLRMVYVTRDTSIASDGRVRSVNGREDVVKAMGGEKAVYGPYFNEENEYVVCYTAPVYRDGAVIGALSLEKDGYRFCELIRDIKFVETGESYIINAEGTDIAVSDQDHIDWVNSQYNAQKLLEQGEDQDARAVNNVEQKGLAGESGIDTGTYTWEGSHYYLVYEPIPSTGWVLLAGLREEEITAMTQSTLHASFVRGPSLLLCAAVFILLTAGLFFWIFSSVRKITRMNVRLKHMASYDELTGLKNRHSYHTDMESLDENGSGSLACIYVDANGLHELNNHLGHQAGDKMLRAVADTLRRYFAESAVYRIGGDEFIIFCQNQSEQELRTKTAQTRQRLKKQGYEISVGTAWRDQRQSVQTMVNQSEENMQQDKQRYYLENGRERQLRVLDRELEQLMTEKQDADAFLSVLAPEFNGVYFVDLCSDTVRHLFIPPYFKTILEEAGGVFSKAVHLYAKREVSPQYRQQFEEVCSYERLQKQLEENTTPEIIYQKNDQTWMQLRVLKFKTYTLQCRETLWIFSGTDSP